jgi:VWFA-related protein
LVHLVKPRLGVALAVALLNGGVLTAQQTNPNSPQPPTFRSAVQIIEVDVRVFDKAGRFVTTLTRDDFEIVEEGAPQRIEAMFLVGATQQPEATAADAPGSAPSTSGPAGPAAPQTWIFFFDLNHLTPGGGFDRARKAVEDFIGTRFKDGDLAGILAGDKMINNRLTSVRKDLLDAVKQVKPRSDARSRDLEMTREWPRFLNEEEAIGVARGEREVVQRVTIRACSDDPSFCAKGDPGPEIREKGQRLQQALHRASQATMASVNALASGLARVPGPKTVVFLSDGFVAQQVETTLRSVVGQTTRAGARVYAIDVRGLNRFGNAGIIDQAQVTDEAGAFAGTDSYADGPNSLAVDTGGMMIRNENNIGRALTQIADDAGRYYVLAYRPANANFDGKFRAIQVKVKGEGLRVRARRGYLALDPARMTVPQPLKPAGDPAPAAPEKQPEAVAATPATEAPVEPKPEPAPTAIGTLVAAPPAVAAVGTVRLRPDTETRVNALSSRDAGPAPRPADARSGLATDLARSGWDAYQRGDVEKALADLSKAAAEPGAKAWVLYALGMAQVAMGRANDAIGSWERVRQAAPDFEPVYMDLADTYSQVAELSRSLAVLRDAEKRWPKSAAVQSAIGVIQVSRGALDEGVTHLAEAAAAAPDDPLMHLNLGRAYYLRFQRGRRYVTSQRRWVAPEGDRQKAAEAFQRCIKLGGPYAQQARDALSVLEWSK